MKKCDKIRISFLLSLAVTLSSTNMLLGENTDAQLKEAIRYYEQGEFSKAASLFEKCLLKDESDVNLVEMIPRSALSAAYKCYEQTGNQEGKNLVSKRLELSEPQEEKNIIRASDAPPPLSKNSEALRNKRTDIYLYALSLTKNYPEITKVLLKEIASTDGGDVERLMHLAQCGVQNNLVDAASGAYEKVLKHDPGNLTAKRNMGLLLFANQKPELALKFLREYNGKTGGDYITNYAQAETMYFLKKKLMPEKADPYFEKALEEAKLMLGVKDAEIICAKSLFRLGKQKESFSAYDNLEEKYPNDIFILLDYAGTLVEAGLLADSHRKLQKLPENIYASDSLKDYNLDKQQLEDVTLKVAVMRIAYEISEKKLFTAKRMLKDLQEHYPKHPELEMSKTSYYTSFQNWRGQLEGINNTLKYLPENDAFVKIKEQLERLHGSYIKNEFGVRLSDNDGVELLDKTELELRVTDDLRLGVNYTVDVANLHDVPRMDGSQKDYHGVRTQAEVFLQGDFINGDTARISFFDQDGIPGVGGRYTLLDYWGNTTLKGAWREPYWGQQQAIAEKGSNTYLQLGRVYRPFDSLTLSGYVSANSYGLKDHQDLARSISIGANVEYKLPQIELQKKYLGELSMFTLNYGLYYENFYHHKTNSDGIREYNPADSQVHSFSVGYSNQFTEDFSGSLYVGYAYDAIGGGPTSGPIYNASLAYMITKKLELSANVGQTISSNKYFYTGLGLKYYFMPETLVDYFIANK